MVRRPPVSTRTDTLCPYTTLFRSDFSPYDYQAIASAGFGHKFIENERTRLSTEVGPVFRRARDAETGEVENGVVSSEEHTSELQSLMRISYAVFCLNKKSNVYFFTSKSPTIHRTYIFLSINL